MSDADPLEPHTSDDADPETGPDESEKNKMKKCQRLFGFNKIMLGWILLVFLIISILTTVLLTLNLYTQDGSKDWVLVGGITSSSATFRIRTDQKDSQARTLVVMTTQNSQVVAQRFNISFSNHVASIDVPNLSPNTAYDYQTLGEANQVVTSGNVRTPALEGTRMNFTIAAAGCAWTGSTSDIFSKIAATQPLLFVHLGDFHYQDINVDNVETRVQAMDKVLQQGKPQAQLFSSTALVYMWDDHDYLGNDSEGEGIGREAALESYRIGFPFYSPLPASSLNTSTSKEVSPYHAFTIGTVRFIISDLRSEANADSIYSQEQKTWLYNEIANSTEYDFVVWVTSKPWIGPDGDDDAWWGQPQDRAELSQHIVQTVTKQNLIALSSDAHVIGFDDGRNTYYGSSSSNVSFPILQSGPLDRLGSAKGGPFSEGCYTTTYERNSQYGAIQFTMPSDTNEEACLVIKTDFFEKTLCGNIFGSTASAGTGSCSASTLSGGSIALLSISGILLVMSMVATCCFLERLEAVRVSAILIFSFFVPPIAGFGIPLAMGVSQYETYTILLISFLQMLVTFMFILFLNSKKKREARKHAEIESQLRDACSEEPPSIAKIKAIAEQYPEAVKAKNEDGERPIHIVCLKGGSLEVVESLHRAWPWGLRAKTNREWIPLHFACFGNTKLEVIQYLVQNWKDSIKAQDNRERLPLHLACFRGASLEVIQYLVGVYPDALKLRDNGGSLPVHLACDNKAPLEVVKWLVEQWPESLKEVNNYGSLALHRACFSGAPPEVIVYLVQQWPESIKCKTNDGDLPLHLASGSGAPMEVVECLVNEWPSSVEQKDNEGKTPLDMAKQPFTFYKPSPQVVEFLKSVGPSSRVRTTMPRRNTKSAPVVKETAVEKALPPKPEKTPSPNTPTPAMPFEKERIKIQEVVAGERDKPVSVPTKYVESIIGNQVLGKGFFGVVRIGKDDAIQQEFAIKTVDRELLVGGTKDDLERIKKDFKREQKALLHARHPNIAMLYAYSISDSLRKGHHLLYELAEKGSLDTFWDGELGRERLSSFRQRAQIALNVFIGLRFLHVGNKHVQPSFHRDIKSGNIVLKRDMTAQLIDCGLATFVHDGNQATSTGVKGTRGYVCPKYCTGSISFAASCDVFSFGVVLAELWSGRLQNHRDPEGKVYNFYEAYIDDEDRKMQDDLDNALGFGVSGELATYMNDFRDLALACMARSPNKRPKGAEVMNLLERIWHGSKQIELDDMSDNGSKVEEEALIFNESLQLVAQFEDVKVDEHTCPRCRTYATEVGEDYCPLCNALQQERFRISKAVSSSLKAQPTAPLKDRSLSSRAENHSLHRIKHGKHDKNMPLVSHLDPRLDNQIPRLFVIVPADLKNGWKHPKVWLRRRVATKYNLYFICAQTYQMARPPIKLVVSKTWVDKISPVLGVSLTLLQMAARKGININLHLGNAAAAMMDLNSAQLNEMLSEASTAMLKIHSELELNVERLSEMLGEVKLIIDEQDERDGHDMMDRIRSGTKLSDRDLNKLNGEAFELIVEKARQDRGWRMAMEPVRKKGDPTIVWVSRGAACDRKNEYEIVDVSASSVQDALPVRDTRPNKPGPSLIDSSCEV